MKKKLLIELFFYAVILAIGIILLFTYKVEKRYFIIPSEFNYQEVQDDAFIPIK
jgi:cytochrome c-type biogenesis protein CcmE